ncbi:hypothetical protein N7489_005026 [Penicillium chrysogenum]|uniref:Uncharacterized protein n=1 Tax=Penicillium chrysogenum TaxID=5076 RepID=A0ABQ8WDM1_PENCH|nr:uncharacterized protein N7489_005026 [Penicillium chrysogenum]KAJ5244930.1 hypothetical protein N7489_005026 [Penicillium chrysogenum]KAJ5264727.1 hypothetical protein N7505_007520 [Penicillium chrysogenum]KAJ5849211.1 hypothetical protein N7534_007900 [Penicillium rubens]
MPRIASPESMFLQCRGLPRLKACLTLRQILSNGLPGLPPQTNLVFADVQKRAGCLVVTHLVPLCSGFSLDLLAHVYRVERGTF